MKRYLGVIVAFIGFVTVLVVAYSKHKERVTDAERELNQVRLQRDFLERAAWLRVEPDEQQFRQEVNALFRWYSREVDQHLLTYGGSPQFTEYLTELDRRAAKKGEKDKENPEERKARYEFVKRVFEPMKAARYAPLWTAADQGMRLDVLRAERKQVNGTPKVRLEVVLWGPQREFKDEGSKGKKVMASASFDVTFKLMDAQNKNAFEMNLTGEPSMKTDYPERYIWAFPPQMLLGYFDLPLLPAETQKAEVTFAVNSRSPLGGVARAGYVWKLDVPAEWKLKPGEKWEGAEESIRAEEEIDPAKAAARQASR